LREAARELCTACTTDAPGTLNVFDSFIAAQQKRLYTQSNAVIFTGTIVSSTSSIGGFSPRQQCLGLFYW
jgi:hypothetical protein